MSPVLNVYHHIENRSGAHPAPNPIFTRGATWRKAAGVWTVWDYGLSFLPELLVSLLLLSRAMAWRFLR